MTLWWMYEVKPDIRIFQGLVRNDEAFAFLNRGKLPQFRNDKREFDLIL